MAELGKLITDYTGVANELSVRQNRSLISELLDEVMDLGVPQYTDFSTLNLLIPAKRNKKLDAQVTQRVTRSV